MSSIKLESNASGTGIFTIASPNSNTNRTLTLPDSTGTVVVTGGAQTIEFAAGSASTPSITTTGDTNTGIFFPAADTIAFTEGGAESMRIDSSGNVMIGTTSQNGKLTVVMPTGSGTLGIQTGSITADSTRLQSGGSVNNWLEYRGYLGHAWFVDATERARINGSGFLKVSNNGSYSSSTGTYHELKSTIVDYPVIYLQQTNASFGGSASLEHTIGSAASSTYDFYKAYSSGTTDTEFKLRGDGNGYADGTWNNNGADYAEFFESANGQALTLGATVVLDGNKVREATEQDPATSIIGVVRPKEPSKASMVVGNTAWNKWANKYLTDDFDRYIMEDHDVVEWTDADGKEHSYMSHNIPAGITVPADAVTKTHDSKGNKFQHYKLNPAWDKNAEYVNRENRPEWNIIGMLGQVKILKGQPVGDRWIKMRDVSATVEEWMVK